jgi:hypothetical protein
VTQEQAAPTWRFVQFGLLVTGKAEADFLPSLFRCLMATGQCHFRVHRKIEQLSPITSQRRLLKERGMGKRLIGRDEEIGLAARRFLQVPDSYVVLIDDLEHGRADQMAAIYDRYRGALDAMLGEQKHRAAVHFLVYMLEVYFFADSRAVNAVLGTAIADYPGDVETIRHPQGELKNLHPTYDARRHGKSILQTLDLRHVLSRADTCASLRTMFAWCVESLSLPFTQEYRLLDGKYHPITCAQLQSRTAAKGHE